MSINFIGYSFVALVAAAARESGARMQTARAAGATRAVVGLEPRAIYAPGFQLTGTPGGAPSLIALVPTMSGEELNATAATQRRQTGHSTKDSGRNMVLPVGVDRLQKQMQGDLFLQACANDKREIINAQGVLPRINPVFFRQTWDEMRLGRIGPGRAGGDSACLWRLSLALTSCA